MRLTLRNLCKIDKNYKQISLKNRKYITPNDLSTSEIKFLFMTALKLKTSSNRSLRSLAGRKISFLLNCPCLQLQTCLHNTSNLLKMPLNIIIDSEWETTPYPQDIGRILSTTSDIIFCKAHRHRKLESFAQGSTVPVVNVSSCRFMLLQVLSSLLTIRQHFGTLENLTIAWIGRTCPVLNTFLLIAPTLNMKIKFLCYYCGGLVSPSQLNEVLSKGNIDSVKECTNLKDAIKGAHVIITNDHSESEFKLTLRDLEMHADKKWVFFHMLPRTANGVEDKIFDTNKNLIWASYMNYNWICAAIISTFLNLKMKSRLK